MNNSNPRKSPRAEWINYDAGIFFITICTKNHIHYFGEIIDGRMNLSEIGRIVDYELSHPQIHHPDIIIPLHVVMPNHIHLLIDLNSSALDISIADMARHVPTSQRNPNPMMRANPEMERHVSMLTRYIASMKSAVTRKARLICSDFGWQPRFHDHLIRNNHDGQNISHYIENNPANWQNDCFY